MPDDLIDLYGFEPMLEYLTSHQGPPGYKVMVCYHKPGWLLECWTNGPRNAFCLIHLHTSKRKWYKTLTGAAKGAKDHG